MRPFLIDHILPAPSDSALWAAWRTDLSRWRDEMRAELHYDGRLYRRADVVWVSSCFSCCFVMACDETLYDHRHGCYTLQAFLDHGRRAFGGYDAIVLWSAYPVIGVDARNQFDYYRDLPGGVDALRTLTRQAHAQGTKLFIAYLPWDTGTRREDTTDEEVLSALVQQIEADGIFLDTMTHIGSMAPGRLWCRRSALRFMRAVGSIRAPVSGRWSIAAQNLSRVACSWSTHAPVSAILI